MKNKNLMLGLLMGVLVPIGVLASNLTLPYTFTAGTPIRAAEVNANFAAVQAAVNSKLDITASGAKSGSRLQVIGLRSADGLAAPAGLENNFYDSQLGVYCLPLVASDGFFRCLPNSASFYFSSPTGSTQLFTDSTCLASSMLFNIYAPYAVQQYRGAPQVTGLYALDGTVFADGGVSYDVRTLVRHFGAVYQDTNGSCAAVTPTQPVYVRGALVAPSTFQEITVGPL